MTDPITPNADAIPAAENKVGRWHIKPFSLQTFIVLEAIDSPLVRPFQTDENGDVKYMTRVNATGERELLLGKDGAPVPLPRPFGMGDVAAALWAFLNWDRPDIGILISNKTALNNEIAHLASSISMKDVAEIQADITRVFTQVNASMKDAGLGDGDDAKKKDGTGPLES